MLHTQLTHSKQVEKHSDNATGMFERTQEVLGVLKLSTRDREGREQIISDQ